MARKRPFSILRTLRFVALVATLLNSVGLVSTVLFYNSSIPAQGIILEWAPSDEAFSTGRTPVIAFIDHRNQKHLLAPQSAAGTANDRMARKIPIRYNPDNPAIFRIDTLMGMWATGVISLLYGLVPLVLLSLLIAATGKKAPGRKHMRKRKSTLGVKHLVDHAQNITATDKPVVRRMR